MSGLGIAEDVARAVVQQLAEQWPPQVAVTTTQTVERSDEDRRVVALQCAAQMYTERGASVADVLVAAQRFAAYITAGAT